MLGALFGAPPFAHGAAAEELQRWNGSQPPSFTLSDSTGADVALESGRGHIVLVHFFATWCEPCVKELPALNRLAARSGDNVKVLAISVAEVDLRVRRFIEATPVNFPVLLDRERAIAKAWNVSTLPTTVVLDGALHSKLVVENEFAWDSIEPSQLTEMLAKTTNGPAKTENLEKLSHRGG